MEINNFYKRYCHDNLPIIIPNFYTWKIGKDKSGSNDIVDFSIREKSY